MTIFEQAAVYAARGAARISPFLIPAAIGNMAAGETAIHIGAQGPSFGAVSACATAGHAIGEAYEMIRRGDAECAVAGGTEAALDPVVIAGFNNMRALSRSASTTNGGDPAAASRPFDSARDGFVMAEGAGVLLLERLDLALARGATPLAEIVGYGASADAAHITLPSPGGYGAVRAARRALDGADRGLQVVHDEVRHLQLRDVGHLRARHLAHLVAKEDRGHAVELEALERVLATHIQKQIHTEATRRIPVGQVILSGRELEGLRFDSRWGGRPVSLGPRIFPRYRRLQ